MSFLDNLAKAFGYTKEPKINAPALSGASVFSEAPLAKTEEYLSTYNSASWVYACTNTIAQEVAAQMVQNLKLWEKKDNDVEEVTDHPVLALLHDVNQFQTSYQLWETTQAYLDLSGDSFWFVSYFETEKKPAELFPLRPDWVSIKPSDTEIIAYYEYRVPGKGVKRIEKHEMLHQKNFNPINFYRGQSTLSALAYAVDTDTFSVKYNRNFFENDAQPKGGIFTENNLTEDQTKRVRTAWRQAHQGTSKAHEVAIFSGGLDWKDYGIKPKDMDFIEQRRFGRDEILGIFRVPKSILGITEDVNRANAEASMVTFEKWSIVPRMRQMVTFLNEFLLPLYPNSEDLMFAFDDPTPENRELTLKEVEVGMKNSVMTINEGRNRLGLEDLPGKEGEQILIPFNVTPAGPAEEAKSKIKFPALNKNKKLMKEIKEDTKRRITSLIAPNKEEKRKKTKEELLEERWKLYVDRSERHALDIQGIVKALFLTQREIILDKLGGKSKTIGDNLFNKDKEVKRWFKALAPVIFSVIETEGKLGLQEVGGSGEFEFTKTNRNITEQKLLRDVRGINKKTRDKLRSEFQEGLDAGESIVDLRQRIERTYAGFEKYRSEKIARSEALLYTNEGLVEGYKQSGVVMGKEWLTAGDERVCQWCGPMSGKTVALDDGFFDKGGSFTGREGGVLNFDFRAIDVPPLHPQCRCTLVPIVEKSATAIMTKKFNKQEKEIDELKDRIEATSELAVKGVKDKEEIKEGLNEINKELDEGNK